MQVYCNEFACSRNWIHACLIQFACLIEVAIKTGLTVHCLHTGISTENSQSENILQEPLKLQMVSTK